MINPPPLPSRARPVLRRLRRSVLRRRRPLAAVCAAVAVIAGLQAAGPPPAASDLVLVASRDLPAGTALTTDDLTEATYADGTAPAGLADDPVGEVLAAPVRRGEPLTDVRLIGPDLTAGRPGLVALPVRLPDSGMVELLDVGDVLDLLAADPQSGGAEVIARGVEVLGLPAPDDAEFSGGTAGLSGRLVVLGVDPSDTSGISASAVRSYVTFTWATR